MCYEKNEKKGGMEKEKEGGDIGKESRGTETERRGRVYGARWRLGRRGSTKVKGGKKRRHRRKKLHPNHGAHQHQR
jgi:hypothetical protein